MSKNWVKDIADMHKKYGVQSKVSELDETSLGALLKFRLDFLAEEYNELCAASLSRPVNAEETVDALIDILVVTIGALHSMGANAEGAWKEVMNTNFAKIDKETGKVRKREDGKVLKPAGWAPPNLEPYLKK